MEHRFPIGLEVDDGLLDFAPELLFLLWRERGDVLYFFWMKRWTFLGMSMELPSRNLNSYIRSFFYKNRAKPLGGLEPPTFRLQGECSAN